jgi:hypothetical protein
MFAGIQNRSPAVVFTEGWYICIHWTVAQVFVLHELVAAMREKKQPVYLCFIDVRKASNRTWPDDLWLRLHECAVRGRMWSMLRAMCEHMRRCVRQLQATDRIVFG